MLFLNRIRLYYSIEMCLISALIRMASSGPTEEVVSAFFSEQIPMFLGQIESQLGKTDSTFVAGEKVV